MGKKDHFKDDFGQIPESCDAENGSWDRFLARYWKIKRKQIRSRMINSASIHHCLPLSGL